MKIIDAHIHFYREEYFDQIAERAGHKNNPEHLREVYREHGIRHAVVMGNRDLGLESHRYPEFLSYCVGLDSHYFKGADLQSAAGLAEQHLKRKSCVGIKLYPGYNPTYVSDSVYHPFYELAEQYGKPVAIHTGLTATSGAALKYSHPLTVDEVAADFPRVQFVMCHLGNPWVVDAVAVMMKNPNVAADLSGLLEGMVPVESLFSENSGYIRHLRTWLAYLGGYDRILYGTDWPLANIPGYIDFVARLIPQQYHEQVFFDNANRIYGLGL